MGVRILSFFEEPRTAEIDTNYSEMEVDYLATFMKSVAEHGVTAVVVLGPDVTCKENAGKTILTMHPWKLHHQAKELCKSVSLNDEQPLAPLAAWSSLNARDRHTPAWFSSWRKQGYQSVTGIRIPITVDRAFECFLFSTLEFMTGRTASQVTWQLLNAWPSILQEYTNKRDYLTSTERIALRHSARGQNAQQTAETMGTSERMVNFHIGNSMRKLEAPNKTAAVYKAMLLGAI